MERIFTEEFDALVQCARDEAMRTGYYEIKPDHLFLAILRQKGNRARYILENKGFDILEAKETIDAAMFRPAQVPYGDMPLVHLSREASDIISIAVANCKVTGSATTGSHHLLMALASAQTPICSEMLAKAGINRGCILEETAGSVPEKAAAELPGTPAQAIADAMEAEILNAIRNNTLLLNDILN